MSHWMPYSNNRLMRSMKRQMLRFVPGMISCKEFEAFIVDYLDDNLSAAQKRVFERHLKLCPECLDYLDDYKKTRDLASMCVRSDCQHVASMGSKVPEDLIAAVVDAITTEDNK